LAPADEEVVAVGFNGEAFEGAVVAVGKGLEERGEVVDVGALVGCDAFDVNETAGKFEDVHKRGRAVVRHQDSS
jgi:hypothetical protein